MRKLFLIALFGLFVTTTPLLAQQNVGIGTITPHPSSVLDLEAKNKGFLLPRMTTIERNNISAPANGLLVYDVDCAELWYYYIHKHPQATVADSGWLPITNNRIATISSNYTASLCDYTILVNALTSAVQVTLPTAIGNKGKEFVIKVIGYANPVTVTSAQFIDGVATYSFSANMQSVTLKSNGQNWWIIHKD